MDFMKYAKNMDKSRFGVTCGYVCNNRKGIGEHERYMDGVGNYEVNGKVNCYQLCVIREETRVNFELFAICKFWDKDRTAPSNLIN